MDIEESIIGEMGRAKNVTGSHADGFPLLTIMVTTATDAQCNSMDARLMHLGGHSHERRERGGTFWISEIGVRDLT